MISVWSFDPRRVRVFANFTVVRTQQLQICKKTPKESRKNPVINSLKLRLFRSPILKEHGWPSKAEIEELAKPT